MASCPSRPIFVAAIALGTLLTACVASDVVIGEEQTNGPPGMCVAQFDCVVGRHFDSVSCSCVLDTTVPDPPDAACTCTIDAGDGGLCRASGLLCVVGMHPGPNCTCVPD